MEQNILSTYIINLPKRIDRKQSILNEFNNRGEFRINIITPVHHKKGAVSFWSTIKRIIQETKRTGEDKVLICEDNHIFTGSYSKKRLFESIIEGEKRDADILCGGISWFQDSLPITQNLYWTNMFSGTQFMLIFKRFFDKLLNSSIEDKDSANYKICSISNRVFFIYPFISVKKGLGYFDIPNKKRRVEDLFKMTSSRLEFLNKIRKHYSNLSLKTIKNVNYNKVSIPTYVINMPERIERLAHIKMEFNNKPEFDLKIIKACKHKIGAVGLWMSIRKIVQLAIDNDNDVIIISEDDHKFTDNYSWKYLLKNILEAHEQGADYLSGGPSYFMDAIPISDNRFWVLVCQATQFIIIFSSFYREILNMPFDDKVISDLSLSNLTFNKMVLYPSISIQKDFGYSDVTLCHNENKNLVQDLFNQTQERFTNLDSIKKKL